MRGSVPRGLLGSLALYGVAVVAYVGVTTWRSPDYQAARHYRAAHERLGKDGGQHASTEALTQAFGELLEAARLEPEVRAIHEELELLNERFVQRRMQLPEALRDRAEETAALYRRLEAERARPIAGNRRRPWVANGVLRQPTRRYKDPVEAAKIAPRMEALNTRLEPVPEKVGEPRMGQPGELPESGRDWDANALLAEPAHKLEWSLLGWLGIAIAWAGSKFIEQQRLEQERLQALASMERQIDGSLRPGESERRSEPGARDRS